MSVQGFLTEGGLSTVLGLCCPSSVAGTSVLLDWSELVTHWSQTATFERGPGHLFKST